MKHYPKTYENLYQQDHRAVNLGNLSALDGTIDELATQFRDFYFESHRQLFNIILKQVWLEMQVVYQGRRRRRRKNGFREDSFFGWFMKSLVGVSQKPIVANMCFTATATYLKEMFPDFLNKDPFKNPEYYPVMTKTKFFGNRIMSFLINKIVGHKFYDVSCGFRAYSKNALLRLNLFGEFTYTQETFLDLAFKKISIIEVPIKVKGIREHGKSRVASNLFRYAFQTSKITAINL